MSAATLQAAEKEVIAEYELKGIPLPEHAVKNDSMDDPCPYCTLVARRAVTMVMSKDDRPN